MPGFLPDLIADDELLFLPRPTTLLEELAVDLPSEELIDAGDTSLVVAIGTAVEAARFTLPEFDAHIAEIAVGAEIVGDDPDPAVAHEINVAEEEGSRIVEEAATDVHNNFERLPEPQEVEFDDSGIPQGDIIIDIPPPVPGPAGPAGPQGPAGPAGPAGEVTIIERVVHVIDDGGVLVPLPDGWSSTPTAPAPEPAPAPATRQIVLVYSQRAADDPDYLEIGWWENGVQGSARIYDAGRGWEVDPLVWIRTFTQPPQP